MNKNELQEAFLKIRASDALIEEVLAMKTENKCSKLSGKFTKVAVIAAVVTALLTTTAFAAPAIYRALTVDKNGGAWEEPTGGSGGVHNLYEVRADLEMNTDAPGSLETYYIPKLDSGYVQYYGFVYKDRMSACYMWTNGEKNWEDEVRFWQEAGAYYDPKDILTVVHTEPGVEPEVKLIELGGVQGYLVEDLILYGTRWFIWSDGNYLLKLEVPDEYSDEDIAEVLRSIEAVEDILPYCVSMTQEDRDDVFG